MHWLDFGELQIQMLQLVCKNVVNSAKSRILLLDKVLKSPAQKASEDEEEVTASLHRFHY